jgi:hypothetical protein
MKELTLEREFAMAELLTRVDRLNERELRLYVRDVVQLAVKTDQELAEYKRLYILSCLNEARLLGMLQRAGELVMKVGGEA